MDDLSVVERKTGDLRGVQGVLGISDYVEAKTALIVAQKEQTLLRIERERGALVPFEEGLAEASGLIEALLTDLDNLPRLLLARYPNCQEVADYAKRLIREARERVADGARPGN